MATRLSVEEQDLLGRIVEKPELQPFFFRKAKGLKWFSALEEKGFFRPENNPAPQAAKEEGYVHVPFWPACEYLVSASAELHEHIGGSYAPRILEVLRSVTTYAREHQFTNYRTWWQFSKVIKNIPPPLLNRQEVVLIDFWLDDPYDRSLVGMEIGATWLPKLLEMQDDHTKRLALWIFEILFKTNSANDAAHASRKSFFRFDDWHAEKISEKIAKKAGEKLGIPAARIIQARLEAVLQDSENDKWSSVLRRAVEDHDQDKHNHDVVSVLVSTFRDALLGAVHAAQTESRSYVGELVDNTYETVRRVAIYAMAEEFEYLRDLIDRVLKPQFLSSNYRHEMWHLLNRRFSALDERHRSTVLTLVNDHSERSDSGEVRAGATAYWQAIWLSALKDQSAQAKALYEKAIQVAGGAPAHPDFSSYMTSGFVIHKSPYTLEDLLTLDIPTLVDRLNSYKDPGEFMGPGIEGLCKTFRQVIKTEPLRYASSLEQFLSSDLAYVNEIVEGFHELWSQKTSLPWDDTWASLLAFCKKLVDEETFWGPKNVEERKSFVANRYWLVGGIARLIEDGVKVDEHSFSAAFLPQAEKIVLRMLSRETGEEFGSRSDAVSIAINSPRGRCLEALINLSLRGSRLEDAEIGSHDNTWKRHQPIYDSELKRAEMGEFEFATLVANYLPNFFYLSREWIVSRLENIFDQRNPQKWRCAMAGYSYVTHIYKEVFDHLKLRGDFIRALDDAAISHQVQNRIVENIAVGFLREYETARDPGSLIDVLLKRAHYDELSHLIWFIWTLRDDNAPELRAKVFALWEQLNAAIDIRTADGRKIASRLCMWISFIDEITPLTKGLMLAVAPFADETHNAFEVLEGIARISARYPEAAYELWLGVLQGSSPDFPEEAIDLALRNIAGAGPQGPRNAKNIVDHYLKSGNDRPAYLMAQSGGKAHQ